MKALKLRDKTSALVLVAHPDDEIIWLGGTIITHPRVQWTVFSLCRSDDLDREPKFRRVNKYLGVRGIITDLDDDGKLNLAGSVAVAEELIRKSLTRKRYDYIFTHGANGEYGHERHLTVHLAVNNLINKKILKPTTVFYFNYKKRIAKTGPTMECKKDSGYIVNFNKTIFKEKQRIVAEMYGYAWDGIDVGLCTDKEGFKLR